MSEEKESVPDKPVFELTPEQESMASRFVTLQYTSGHLKYSRTAIETIASDNSSGHSADEVMVGLHSVICKQIVDEYRRDGYLSKNSHRRLTQVLNMYRFDIMEKLKCDVEAAVEQALILDRYSEKISKAYHASRVSGNVETVERFPDTIEKRRAASLRSKGEQS